jgi:hypothetical protein
MEEGQAPMQEALTKPTRPIYLNTSSHLGLAKFLNWLELFQFCRDERYPPLPILVDLVDNEEKDDEVYINIRKSHLHNATARPTILPYTKVIH